MCRRFIANFLIIFFVLPLFLPCLAQNCDKENRKVRGNFACAYWSLAANSPTAAVIRSNPKLQSNIEPLIALLKKFFDLVDHRTKVGHERACNLPLQLWSTENPKVVEDLQLGTFETSCKTLIDVNEAISERNVSSPFFESSDIDTATTTIRTAVNDLFEAIKTISAIPLGDKNWKKGVHALINWTLNSTSQQCKIETAYAFRKDGDIYVRAVLTNSPIDAFEASEERHFVEEYIKIDFSESLRMCHPEYTSNFSCTLQNRKTFEPGESTTLLSVLGGKGRISLHNTMDLEENPAVVEALRLNEVAVDQAEDSVTPSNIALLALPMVMSLIPVAFLAELNTWATIAYIIFTDLFSTLPFLIKGVELVETAEVQRRELIGYHQGNKTLGELEVWVAECSGQHSFYVLGVIFIVIGVTAIVTGVLIELGAHVAMRRKRRKLGRDVEGPFGKAAFEKTAFGFSGAANEDEKDRRYSTEQWRYEGGMGNEGGWLRKRWNTRKTKKALQRGGIGAGGLDVNEMSRDAGGEATITAGGVESTRTRESSGVGAGAGSTTWGDAEPEYAMKEELRTDQ